MIILAIQIVTVTENPNVAGSLVSALKDSPAYEVAANYKDASTALGQSRIFKPDLFLMDVDKTENINLISSFKALYPNSEVLGLLETWDSKTSYFCLKAGATGCVLKNFSVEEMQRSLELYKLRGQSKPARIIPFFSPKGRAGRTTVAAILSLMLAKKTGERVALIDADLQFGDMPIFFDIEPDNTIIDAIKDVGLLTPMNFESYFYKINPKVSLLSSPTRPEYAELVSSESLVDVVRMTCTLFRYVLIDLPVGFNPISISMCDLAGTSFVLAMLNNNFDIVHMRRALEMFKTYRHDSKKIYTCFTRVNPCTEEERLKLQRELGYPLNNILPNEYQTITLANKGKIGKCLPEDTLLMEKLDKIVDDIISGRL